MIFLNYLMMVWICACTLLLIISWFLHYVITVISFLCFFNDWLKVFQVFFCDSSMFLRTYNVYLINVLCCSNKFVYDCLRMFLWIYGVCLMVSEWYYNVCVIVFCFLHYLIIVLWLSYVFLLWLSYDCLNYLKFVFVCYCDFLIISDDIYHLLYCSYECLMIFCWFLNYIMIVFVCYCDILNFSWFSSLSEICLAILLRVFLWLYYGFLIIMWCSYACCCGCLEFLLMIFFILLTCSCVVLMISYDCLTIS